VLPTRYIYRSPQCNWNDFLDAMNNVIFDGRTLPIPPTIVCGDFNVDLLESNENAPLKKYFDHIGLKLKLPRIVTTKFYTKIDDVFNNI